MGNSGIKPVWGTVAWSLANGAPSASFVKALFSKVVKIKVGQKTIYLVHYEYYTPAERLYKAEGSERTYTIGLPQYVSFIAASSV